MMKSVLALAAFHAIVIFFAGSACAQDATNVPSSTMETYNDWNLACANVPTAPAAAADPTKKDAATTAPATATVNVCEVSQLYNNKANGMEVARMSFFDNPANKDQVDAGLRVPVDVSFDKPVRVIDGDKELLKAGFKRCAGKYCYAVFENVSSQLQALGAAAALSFEYPVSNGQVVHVPMSSRGLINALDALKKHQ